MRSVLIAAVLATLGCGPGQPTRTIPAAEDSWDLDVDPAEERRADQRRARPAPRVVASAAPAPKPHPTYRGKRIDIDLKGAELHDVFRLLSDVSGANIVVSDEVKGRVTLRLRRVPWDQVLHTVVAVKRLALYHEHGVYRVMPRETRP